MAKIDPPPRLSRRVTSIDVAKAAGVSQSAVSLWTTGKYAGRLSPELQERIAKAVAKLGYVPNRTAQRLLQGSRTVAFIFPGYSYTFFNHILEGVGGVLDRSWDLTFHDSRLGRGRPDIENIVTATVAADITGVILASPSAEEVEAVRRVAAAAVIVDSPVAPDNAALVAFDLRDSLAAAARDLREKGHRDIGYVSFVASSLTLSDRRRLTVAALRSEGLRLVGPDLRLESLDTPTTVARFAEKWPSWRRAGVTALVCADDRQAFGIIRAGRELGIDIPRELSLVAFNDSESAALVAPSLASIRLPAVDIGAAAARALTELVVEDRRSEILIPTAYVARESLGVARS